MEKTALISIHAAREGGDLCGLFPALHKVIFQSTPPVKAATRHNTIAQHKPCISIHAAREGGDI